ncbi:MAG: hypothetical protein R3C14_22710 [Caldilineaceae bacterium]
MEINQLIERTQQVRGAHVDGTVRQRMAQLAQEVSRAGDNQARVELLNESVLALASILYDTDPDGHPANVDSRTGRILPPTPWGRSGWQRWGLRRWEAEILSGILRSRAETRRHSALFDYNAEARTWHVDLGAYPTKERAFAYLSAYPISLAEWRPMADAHRERSFLHMRRKRGLE